MSKAIYNPTLASVEEHTNESATFTIEPLQAGYGNTLGNSLRRVLLSSVRGGAIVAFRIQGATHEFTAIEGIKEDVVDIMLNIKNIRLRVLTDEPVELRLEKHGSGPILAGDIQTTADVEIVNPEQIIATVDDPNGSVVIDFVAEAGRGYLTIEDSTVDRLHSDMIAVDAVFSPVLRVRYKVGGTRVGQETNLDKLTLTVDTDGTMSPKDAFGSTRVEAAPALVQPQQQNDESELNTPIEDLDLSSRTANALINNDIRTVYDLVTLSEQDLRELKGFGSKALDEVKDKLAELEL